MAIIKHFARLRNWWKKSWQVPPEVQLFPCSLHSLPRDGIVVETEQGNQNEDYRRNGHQQLEG